MIISIIIIVFIFPKSKNKCIVRLVGATNMPVPILEQIMTGSVCIAHFRSWPFKSSCANSP